MSVILIFVVVVVFLLPLVLIFIDSNFLYLTFKRLMKAGLCPPRNVDKRLYFCRNCLRCLVFFVHSIEVYSARSPAFSFFRVVWSSRFESLCWSHSTEVLVKGIPAWTYNNALMSSVKGRKVTKNPFDQNITAVRAEEDSLMHARTTTKTLSHTHTHDNKHTRTHTHDYTHTRFGSPATHQRNSVIHLHVIKLYCFHPVELRDVFEEPK